MRYNSDMIKSFADSNTEALFCDGVPRKLPSEVTARALRKLDMVDAAHTPDDLRVPPDNRLHRLQGERFGQYAIVVNAQWRICFRFEGEDAYDVELRDYH